MNFLAYAVPRRDPVSIYLHATKFIKAGTKLCIVFVLLCHAANAACPIEPDAVPGKVTLNIKNITPAMLYDESYVSSSYERNALTLWLAHRRCEYYGASPTYLEVIRKTDMLIQKLIDHQITYGQFNSLRLWNVDHPYTP